MYHACARQMSLADTINHYFVTEHCMILCASLGFCKAKDIPILLGALPGYRGFVPCGFQCSHTKGKESCVPRHEDIQEKGIEPHSCCKQGPMVTFVCGTKYRDWLWDGQMTGLNSSPGSDQIPLHSVHTGSGNHPDSCPMGTGGSFLGDKAAGA
jgi:hypothetical protein